MKTFSELRKAEHDWIRLQLKAASAFVRAFSPSDAWDPVRLEALDRAFSKWMNTRPRDMDDVNGVINAVGIAFGSILVEKQGFTWTSVEYEQGTDLAVRALPNAGDILVFPANFVAKRWDRKETDFLVGASEQIARQVEKVRAEWQAH
jgi:hypothetical protein